MGTSKGYIAPTTPHWSQAKRAVTSYINSGDGESRAKAASKYASAMHHDIATSEQFTKAAGSILSFAQAVSRGGINNALHEFNRNDLIGKSSDEIYNELIEDVYAGDEYGKNIVNLYNPLNYIGEEDTEDPTWVRIVMGASEGDMSMFSSLNLQIAMLNAGVDAEIEWQWDGGHVPSEILGESFALYVDQMYGEYVEGAVSVEKPEAEAQQENGTSEEATGTDLTSWVNCEDVSQVSFTLADAVAYRTKGASKAMPAFDVIDYGQEDYVFGDEEQDARHWNQTLLKIFEEHGDVLAELFNK